MPVGAPIAGPVPAVRVAAGCVGVPRGAAPRPHSARSSQAVDGAARTAGSTAAARALRPAVGRRRCSSQIQCSQLPGSPWRPARPASWRSSRRDGLCWHRQHVQAAGGQCGGVGLDIGATAGHARGDGDPAGDAGLRDDGRLLRIVQRIEHLVFDAGLVAAGSTTAVGVGDAVGADQHRPALRLQCCHASGDGVEQHRSVAWRIGAAAGRGAGCAGAGGMRTTRAPYDRLQFRSGLEQRSADAAQAPVALEEALERGLGHGFGLRRRADALLERDHGVQAARPDPSRRHAAGHLVEQLDGAVAHHVVDVALVEHAARPAPSRWHRAGSVAGARARPGPRHSCCRRCSPWGVSSAARSIACTVKSCRASSWRASASACHRKARRAAWGAARDRISGTSASSSRMLSASSSKAMHRPRISGCAAAVRRQCGGDALGRSRRGQRLAIAQVVEGQVLGRGVDDRAGISRAPRRIVALRRPASTRADRVPQTPAPEAARRAAPGSHWR